MYTSRADLHTLINRGNNEAESAHANMKLTLVVKKDFIKIPTSAAKCVTFQTYPLVLSECPGRNIKSQCLMLKVCTGDRDCGVG